MWQGVARRTSASASASPLLSTGLAYDLSVCLLAVLTLGSHLLSGRPCNAFSWR